MRLQPANVATVVTTLLHARPRAGTQPSMNTLTPLYDFTQSTDTVLEKWERIDDVIMGGVSSSRFVPAADESCAVFEGRVRSDGGGFCGQRMKLLADPIDLSASEGLFLDCAASASIGPAPAKRVWKMALRTKQDRGEVVYQKMFSPPVDGRGTIKLPFSDFRLVRGPRLVPGAPPLTPESTNATYQMSIVVSKFTVSEDGSALPEFEEGPFSLKIYQVGTYGASSSSAAAAAIAEMPRALTKEEQAKAAPLPVRVLRPVLSVLFGEVVRRRAAATRLLEARGSTRMQRFKLAWSWRVAASGGVLGAARRTSSVALSGAAATALSVPIRLLFRCLVLVSRAIKMLKGGGGAKKAAAAAAAAAVQGSGNTVNRLEPEPAA